MIESWLARENPTKHGVKPVPMPYDVAQDINIEKWYEAETTSVRRKNEVTSGSTVRPFSLRPFRRALSSSLGPETVRLSPPPFNMHRLQPWRSEDLHMSGQSWLDASSVHIPAYSVIRDAVSMYNGQPTCLLPIRCFLLRASTFSRYFFQRPLQWRASTVSYCLYSINLNTELNAVTSD
jgi:hypothetical protein